MSELLTKIKADLLSARKERNTAKISCLSTLVGECSTKEKSTTNPFTDVDAQGVIKKTVKNLNACLENNISPEVAEGFKQELNWLEAYLPKTMSDEELTMAMRKIIINAEVDTVTVGYVMGQLKQKHAGLYDGAKAKKIWDKLNGL